MNSNIDLKQYNKNTDIKTSVFLFVHCDRISIEAIIFCKI